MLGLKELSEAERKHHLRTLARTDLYFLLRYLLNRTDIERQWLFERCKEVSESPDGHLDLWAREHYKSTLITFGKTIQDILSSHGDDAPNLRECTIGIFSHTRPNAKGFLRQIKQELEGNKVLQELFPDVLYAYPHREAVKWALDIDTPVLTSTGWKKHGDLEIGDKIYGSNGTLISVTGNSGPMFNADCRRVVFDDCEIVASTDHLWPVQHKYGHTWVESEIRIYRTEELTVGKKNKRMPPTPSIDGNDAEYLVHPYILGLWLGDGTAGTNIISMHRDDEIETLEKINSLGYETYIHRRKPNDNFSMYGIRGLKELLQTVGCLRKKYIPDEYLYGNKESRLSLLQGLMDSDGTCKKESKHRGGGMCMFSNTNINLSSGVFHLATSLGFRPSTLNFMPKSIGKLRVYHVYFLGIKSFAPFSLKRKLDNCKVKRHQTGRYIRAIEKIPSVTVNCIKVDAPDSLYLAGESLVLTHNSEDEGITVRRKSNPKEATVEAWGLVDGQPTGKHFTLCVYDDIVTRESVTSPEMIAKTTTALELSYNLGAEGGQKRFIGTRYHYNDSYKTIIDRGTAIPRVYPATHDGTPDGTPVLLTRERLVEKRRDLGPYTFSCQLLQNPQADETQGFLEPWLKYYDHVSLKGLNIYVMFDPANGKKKGNDYTCGWVVGLGSDGNIRVLDIVRDRLNLSERTDLVFRWHRKYKPMRQDGVRYEQYGMQADIQHIQTKQVEENYLFEITPVAGRTSKNDRIKRMIPYFEQGKILFPRQLNYTDYQGKTRDLVQDFIQEEYKPFPVGIHDDMMDGLARLFEPELPLVFPKEIVTDPMIPFYVFDQFASDNNWMG